MFANFFQWMLGQRKKFFVSFGIFILCIVFVSSATTKFIALTDFENSLRSFGVISPRFLPFTAILIPLVELTLVPMLIIRTTRHLAVYLSFTLLSCFTSVVVFTLISGAEVSCSCFGNFSNQSIGIRTLIRNTVLLAIGTLLLWNDLHADVENADIHINIGRTELFFYMISAVMLAGFITFGALTLIQQNSIYKERIKILTRSYYLEPQQKAPVLFLSTVKDSTFSFSLNDSPGIVIFIMKHRCIPCEIIQPFWNSLVLKYAQVKFLGILNDSPEIYKIYSSTSKLLFPLYLALPSTRKDYKILSTPQTIVVRNDTIVKTYNGLLNEEEQKEITAVLNQFVLD